MKLPSSGKNLMCIDQYAHLVHTSYSKKAIVEQENLVGLDHSFLHASANVDFRFIVGFAISI